MDNIYQEAYFRKVITGTVNFLWSLPIKKASNHNRYGHVNFIIIYHFYLYYPGRENHAVKKNCYSQKVWSTQDRSFNMPTQGIISNWKLSPGILR